MTDDGTANEGGLVRCTLAQLLDDGKLPSGNRFTLMPDTVEVALAIGECQDPRQWRLKLMQVLRSVDKINGQDARELGGVDFLANMIDADIVIMGMAWTAEMNDRRFEINESTACPECGAPFRHIDLSNIGILCRTDPVGPMESIKEVKIDKKWEPKLPRSLKKGTFYIKDPTWKSSREHIPDNVMDRLELVEIYRTMATLLFKSSESESGGTPRGVSIAEAKAMPQRLLLEIRNQVREHSPRIEDSMKLVCETCKASFDVPFDQAVG